MEKTEARRIIKRLIEGMTLAERAARSEAIRVRLLALPELVAARSVMGYLPMPDELDTRPVLADLIAEGKRVYVPRTFVKERRMFPVRLASMAALREGEYGIMEPDTNETCDPSELDFVLLPGRAFDRRGNRLGRGAGFYDRFLSAPGFRAVRCAAAFACQVLPRVPHNEHDVPVELLVTEEELLRCGRSSG